MNTYETPSVEILELCTESVLCTSGAFDPWEEDTLEWND